MCRGFCAATNYIRKFESDVRCDDKKERPIKRGQEIRAQSETLAEIERHQKFMN